MCHNYDLRVAPAMAALSSNIAVLSRPNRILVLKTLANSWTTSTRYHESVRLSCVFGCGHNCPVPSNRDTEDSVRHYLCCPFLWGAIQSCLTVPVPRDPRERLGISAPGLDLRPLAISYCVYHRIKQQHYSLVRNMYSRAEWGKVLQLATAAASAFVAEIMK